MTGHFLIYFLVLAALGSVGAILATPFQRAFLPVSILFLTSFGARAALIFINERLSIFRAKDSGDSALELFRYRTSIKDAFEQVSGNSSFTEFILNAKFIPQAAVNYPGFLAFGFERPTLLLTNAFLGAASGIVAFSYLSRLFCLNTGLVALALVSLYPAAITFSLFGTRDVIIFLALTANILSAMWLFMRNNYTALNIFVFSITLLTLCLSRIQFSAFAFLFPLLTIITVAWHKGWKSDSSSKSYLYYCVISLASAALISAVAIFGYRYTAFSIGPNFASLSPFEFIEYYGQTRYERALDDAAFGAGSHILPPETYFSLPFPVRLALQIVGIIIVPMPWLLTDLSRGLALLDSIFVVACIVWGYRATRRSWAAYSPFKSLVARRLSSTILVCFIVCTIAIGVVTINGGNAYRLRLNIVPFILISASIYLGGKRSRSQENSLYYFVRKAGKVRE